MSDVCDDVVSKTRTVETPPEREMSCFEFADCDGQKRRKEDEEEEERRERISTWEKRGREREKNISHANQSRMNIIDYGFRNG